MREVKDAVLELAKELPDECTWDEVHVQDLRPSKD